MEVIKITPRGYCYGVVDALALAMRTVHNLNVPRPIYLLGMIVHNAHVTEFLRQEGIVTLDGPNRLDILEQVQEGTVIFTAHGVSPEVRKRAADKGLTVVDATCPDVTRTHNLIREKAAQGYDIIYIGKKGHPEPEGAMGVSPGQVHLVEKAEDIGGLMLQGEKILITNQTTMSQWDIKDMVNKLIGRFPKAEIHNEICLATQLRQEAVAEQAGEADLAIIVGDPRSNNSSRLAQVAEHIAGVRAYRIADLGELDPAWLEGASKVAVSSGASTPTPITKEVVDYLEQYDPCDPATWERKRSVNMKRLIPAARQRSK